MYFIEEEDMTGTISGVNLLDYPGCYNRIEYALTNCKKGYIDVEFALMGFSVIQEDGTPLLDLNTGPSIKLSGIALSDIMDNLDNLIDKNYEEHNYYFYDYTVFVNHYIEDLFEHIREKIKYNPK